jgi:hypothetical protein
MNDGAFDAYLKLKAQVPPAKYEELVDWSATSTFNNRGKFQKAERITYLDSILREGKKRPRPAPTSYKYKEFFGKGVSLNKKGSTAEKICGFIEQAKWQGQQTAKLNHNKNYSMVDKSSRTAKIWKDSTDKPQV